MTSDQYRPRRHSIKLPSSDWGGAYARWQTINSVVVYFTEQTPAPTLELFRLHLEYTSKNCSLRLCAAQARQRARPVAHHLQHIYTQTDIAEDQILLCGSNEFRSDTDKERFESPEALAVANVRTSRRFVRV